MATIGIGMAVIIFLVLQTPEMLSTEIYMQGREKMMGKEEEI
jgi:hypothetical protein